MRTKLGLIVASGLLVVACGGAAPQASPTAATGQSPAAQTEAPAAPTDTPAAATPTDQPATQEPATQEPATQEPATDAPGSLAPDQPLEDLFPDEIGGRTIEPQSASGQDVLTLIGEDDPTELNEFLRNLGATIDDMSVAMALSFGPGATADEFTGVSIFAYRIRGTQGSDVVTRLAQLAADEEEEAQIGSAVVSGKSVVTVGEPDAGDDEQAYLYAVGDVVFLVGGTPALVEETFSKLP